MSRNTQIAPFPQELADLVEAIHYKKGWDLTLEDDLDRGQGSKGLTLVIHILTPDSYHPDQSRAVNHYFPVPPAAYDRRSWQRWLLDRVLLVETHEAMEFFALRDDSLLGGGTRCSTCCHAMTRHDGRDSSCQDCAYEDHHRFSPFEEAYVYARPYAPSHGPGNDPYMIREVGSKLDQRTAYTGKVH